MNIHQFDYVLALAELQHFEKAAEQCFVTQSTLSTMISKFEEELGILIFDRKRKPVSLSVEGERIVEQLKIIRREIEHLREIRQEIKGEVSGRLTISVIPTIAPFLLPLFLSRFAARFPKLEIEIREQTTAEIMKQIRLREVDIGIVSVPVNDEELREIHLYDEPFVYYESVGIGKNGMQVEEVDLSRLYLLEEGHCMRTQILELCDARDQIPFRKINFTFKAGSIDSLMRFVRANEASTLLPYLSVHEFSEKEKEHLSYFNEPLPYRAVGMLVHRHFVRDGVLRALKDEILQSTESILPAMRLAARPLAPL